MSQFQNFQIYHENFSYITKIVKFPCTALLNYARVCYVITSQARQYMKPNIHPDNYRTVLFFDSSANEGWLIRSCAETHGKTMVWTDGKEYPLFSLDTSSSSHPVYTGKQRNVNTEGRASKFNQRFQSVMSSFRKDK